MTVLLVVSILALILSPLSWLRTSRKQSEQMKLRLEARHMGLAMQLAPQQWPHWLEKEPPSPCPQYHRARRRGHEDSFCFWQITPGFGGTSGVNPARTHASWRPWHACRRVSTRSRAMPG